MTPRGLAETGDGGWLDSSGFVSELGRERRETLVAVATGRG